MGNRYMWFRVRHELAKKSGLLAKRFPINPTKIKGPGLSEAHQILDQWVWHSAEELALSQVPANELKSKALSILDGNLLLFNSIPHTFRNDEDWIIHPETGYRYNNQLHWTRIPDMSPEAGDIKYVWEKSRFSYLHTILRYDHHFGEDHSEWVFSELDSWIRMNPINCGPNYRCSQEISLRVFNWLGALQFYKNKPGLTEERWSRYYYNMYWQMHHVWENIEFSRIAVRNNHAITETLALYIFGTMFPDAPGASKWKIKGKAWIEEEIAYQIYPDGSYLQFSMNYHRVVVQLLTLAIRFSEKQGESFQPVVYQRADKTLRFLQFFQDPVSGELPNYGANDGALFFQFTDLPYRHYSSQLNALHAALYGQNIAGSVHNEEALWFGYPKKALLPSIATIPEKLQVFGSGGFAGIKEKDTLTFFRSGTHKDRPSQADNHHLDLWFEGENILRDAGSYKYNAGEEDIRFFFGTRSHNTVMIDSQDQMVKGPRFVWMKWSQSIGLSAREEENGWTISGEIEAFRQIRKGIHHKRTVHKVRGKAIWTITDEITGLKGEDVQVIWHPSPEFSTRFTMTVRDQNGTVITPEVQPGWYSGLYGTKEEAAYWIFSSQSTKITTQISINSY